MKRMMVLGLVAALGAPLMACTEDGRMNGEVLGPVVDLKLLGLFGVVLRPRAIALTAATSGVVVLLLGQWVNLALL